MKKLLSLTNVSSNQSLYVMVLTTNYDNQNNVEIILCSNKEDFIDLGFQEYEIDIINGLSVDEEYLCEDYDGVSVKRIA